jgi:hypothetical protein
LVIKPAELPLHQFSTAAAKQKISGAILLSLIVCRQQTFPIKIFVAQRIKMRVEQIVTGVIYQRLQGWRRADYPPARSF